ncbi:MAG: MBL fold metallo-hydrolase [Patescibacteria group bacterium]|nr:MBL fold metallo-hydrolase [Patescibacteria group bacterium]
MVEIVYLGHSCFKITGKEISIVADPYKESMVGLKLPKVEADVVTISHDHPDHNNKEGLRGEYLCFDTPGEYEIKKAEIVGIESYHDSVNGEERGKNTIFVYEIDGIHICHLGDLGQALTSEQLEKINGVDILLVPVGGKYTIGPKEAAKAISATSPKIVIPMHYRVGKMTDLEPLEGFIKEIGKEPKKVDTLKIAKKDLTEELEIYTLKSKG